MYIEKRWLVPAALSLLLLGALFAIVLLLLGSRVPDVTGSARAAEISSAAKGSQEAEPEDEGSDAPAPEVVPAAALTPPTNLAPPVDAVPVADTSDAVPAPPVATDAAPSIPQPEEVVDIETLGSKDTQINTRGFGDVGMQFQNVNVNAPITNVHISNQGNNNSTNVNIGDHDKIVSEQEHLQANRRDGGGQLGDSQPPAESASPDGAGAQSESPERAQPAETSTGDGDVEQASAPVPQE
jgi:hypothetical protein